MRVIKRPETVYQPSLTVSKFLESDAQIKAIVGPVGSGKSVACCINLLKYIEAQPHSRWAIIRNSYRELQDTTLATWDAWTQGMGSFSQTQMKWTCVNGAEVLFRALDRPADIGKLLSLELTGCFINEARQIPRAVFDMVQTRVGRFPRTIDGGPKWHGVIIDSNPCDDFHWLYRLFAEDLPDGWELYRQPGGLTDEAENVSNLPADYYTNIARGKDAAWIDVYVNGNWGFIIDGKPVYPQWIDRIHAARAEPDSSQPLILGLDWGLTPAAVFVQRSVSGQYRAVAELVTDDMSAVQFADELGRILRADWQGAELDIWGDPAGEQRSQVDARTPFMIMKAAGLEARAAPTNDPRLRVEAVVRNLTRLTMAGDPGLIVDPSCRYLRRGMAGGYKYQQLQVVGDERYHEQPLKNQYSHVCEALQYALCGAGEVRATLGRGKRKPLDYSKMDSEVI